MRPGSKNSATRDRIPGRNYFVCGQGGWDASNEAEPRERTGTGRGNEELGERGLDRARTRVQFKSYLVTEE